MLKTIKGRFNDYFSKGHERTLKAKKNIAISFVLKGVSIAIGFIIVPMTINYVNQAQYGVWLTLSSIISWFSFFDIGLGNGLKNKLAESNALKQYDRSVAYVSTTYAILTIISTILFILFLAANQFINWAKILNTPGNDLNDIALIIFGCFCVQFVVQIINTVLTAFHAPSKVSLINVAGQLVSVVIIYILTKNTTGSLIYLAIVLAGVPILIQFLAGVWYYNTDFKIVAPNFKKIDFKYLKDLLSIGGAFFIIQIGALILFQTDNIIITQLFGPGQVTVFNVSYKLFSVVIMIYSIFLTPFWSAYTDAYTKNDYDWMRNSFNKTRKLWALLSAGCVLIFFASPLVYKLWLHGKVDVPVSISLAMALYGIGYNWLAMHCYLLNGLGKIRIQLYVYIFSIFVNVPLAIFLARYFGVAGVTLSNVVIFIIMGAILWVQCNKILNKSATGIWDK